ncbi:MAG: hypothetical protein HXS54_03050 [Theionarchaea archaeon]|nr:hypothetical protein [Theionarchaea archaeon]
MIEIEKRIEGIPDYSGEIEVYESFGYRKNPFHPIGEPFLEPSEPLPKLVDLEEQKNRIREFVEITLQEKKTTVAGLTGEYGTGKTHFLRYILEKINKRTYKGLENELNRAIAFYLKPFYNEERNIYLYNIENLYKELEDAMENMAAQGLLQNISQKELMEYYENQKQRNIRQMDKPLKFTLLMLRALVRKLNDLGYSRAYLLIDQIEDLDKFEAQVQRQFALDLREVIASSIEGLHLILGFSVDSWNSMVEIHEALESRFPSKYLLSLNRFTSEDSVEFTKERVSSAFLDRSKDERPLFYPNAIHAVWRACSELPRYICQVNHVLFYDACKEKRRIDYNLVIKELERFGMISRNMIEIYQKKIQNTIEREVFDLLVGEFNVYTIEQISERLNFPPKDIEKAILRLLEIEIIEKIGLEYDRDLIIKRFGNAKITEIDQNLSRIVGLYTLTKDMEERIFFTRTEEKRVKTLVTSVPEKRKDFQEIINTEIEGDGKKSQIYKIITQKGRDYYSAILNGIIKILKNADIPEIPSIASVKEIGIDSRNSITYWNLATRTQRNITVQISFILNDVDKSFISILYDGFLEKNCDLGIILHEKDFKRDEILKRTEKTRKGLYFDDCLIFVKFEQEDFDALASLTGVQNQDALIEHTKDFFSLINFESRFQEWYNSMQEKAVIIESINRSAHELLIAILQNCLTKVEQMIQTKDRIWDSGGDRQLNTYLNDLLRTQRLRYMEDEDTYVPCNSPNEERILHFLSYFPEGLKSSEIESYFISSSTHFGRNLEYLELKGQIRSIGTKYYLFLEKDLKEEFQNTLGELQNTYMEEISEESQEYLKETGNAIRSIQKEFKDVVELPNEIIRKWRFMYLLRQCSNVMNNMNEALSSFESNKSKYEKIKSLVEEEESRKKEALEILTKDQQKAFDELSSLLDLSNQQLRRGGAEEIDKTLLKVKNKISEIRRTKRDQESNKKRFEILESDLRNKLKTIEDYHRRGDLSKELLKRSSELLRSTQDSLNFVNEFTGNREYERAFDFLSKKNDEAINLLGSIKTFETDKSSRERQLIERIENRCSIIHSAIERNEKLVNHCQPILEEIKTGIATLGYHHESGDHKEFEECYHQNKTLLEAIFDNLSEEYKIIAKYVFLEIEEELITPQSISEKLGISIDSAKKKLRSMADDGLLQEEFRK